MLLCKGVNIFQHPEILPYDREVLNIMDATCIYYFLQRKKIITQVLITNIESLNLQCGCVISAKKKQENIPSLSFALMSFRTSYWHPIFFNMHPFAYCYI